jgi:beta-1,4-glucosyltransferase
MLRLEWLFRMLLEPKRLVKRYTVDIIYFLYLCLKHKYNAQ